MIGGWAKTESDEFLCFLGLGRGADLLPAPPSCAEKAQNRTNSGNWATSDFAQPPIIYPKNWIDDSRNNDTKLFGSPNQGVRWCEAPEELFIRQTH